MVSIEDAAHAALISAWVRRGNYRRRLIAEGVDVVTAIHTPEESGEPTEASPPLSPKWACGVERGPQPARETNCVPLVSVALQDDQPTPDLNMAPVRWLPPAIGNDVASVTPHIADKALSAFDEKVAPTAGDEEGGIAAGATPMRSRRSGNNGAG